MSTTWSYGVTAVEGRLSNLLPATLKSMAAAGFDKPRVFIDGRSGGGWLLTVEDDYCSKLGFAQTTRPAPALGPWGNWILSLYELFLRDPTAHLYALFQDDLLCCKGLKDYLTKTLGPHCPHTGARKCYYNLFTFWKNEPRVYDRPPGWHPSDQGGRGAVALVFSREGVMELLSSSHCVCRPLTVGRGFKVVDGGVSEAMRKANWTEMIHNPSLVQHTGAESTIGNNNQPKALTWRGEEWDAMSLLQEPPPNYTSVVTANTPEEAALLKAIADDEARLQAGVDKYTSARINSHLRRYRLELEEIRRHGSAVPDGQPG